MNWQKTALPSLEKNAFMVDFPWSSNLIHLQTCRFSKGPGVPGSLHLHCFDSTESQVDVGVGICLRRYFWSPKNEEIDGSLDRFKGKSTGNPGFFYHQIDRAFRCKFSHHPILWMVNHVILGPIFLMSGGIILSESAEQCGNTQVVTDSAKQSAIASWRSVPLAKVGQVGHHGKKVPSIPVDIVTHLLSHMDFCDSENFQCWF